jgi:RHS repeat-associated protein
VSDKLVSGNGLSFEYDGLGNRRANGNKRYVIDITGMGNVLAETNASGSPTAYYLYGAGLEARILPDGTTEYYVSDYRGSTVAMVDASSSAAITHKYQYNDFGTITQKQESDPNPFCYVGKYGVMYENDQLYFMRARYYDPTIGRFLSEDPIWSTNLYPYADNNPVMGIDPMGLSTLKELWEVTQRYTRAKAVYENLKRIQKNDDGFWYFVARMKWLGCDIYLSEEFKIARDNYNQVEKEYKEIKETVRYDISKGGFHVNAYVTAASYYTDPKEVSSKNLKVLLSSENINKSYEEWQRLQFTY